MGGYFLREKRKCINIKGSGNKICLTFSKNKVSIRKIIVTNFFFCHFYVDFNCGCFIPFLFNFCEDLGLVGLCFKIILKTYLFIFYTFYTTKVLFFYILFIIYFYF